ncbi:MAG: aldehyde dehydrogenase family protein, partial [Clostridia bacterium]|nr:aldehyde dehydrogenase family protein [Clostridia bacterium]
MTEKEITDLIKRQKDGIISRPPSPVKDRIASLDRLSQSIKKHEMAICDALKADLNKSREESYMCEIGGVLSEISFMIKHVGKFSKTRKVRTGIANFPAKSYIRPTPLGCCLIMAPWNYPFLLSLDPLVDAVAAGNSVLLRPSSSSPHVAAVLEDIISEVFDEKQA